MESYIMNPAASGYASSKYQNPYFDPLFLQTLTPDPILSWPTLERGEWLMVLARRSCTRPWALSWIGQGLVITTCQGSREPNKWRPVARISLSSVLGRGPSFRGSQEEMWTLKLHRRHQQPNTLQKLIEISRIRNSLWGRILDSIFHHATQNCTSQYLTNTKQSNQAWTIPTVNSTSTKAHQWVAAPRATSRMPRSWSRYLGPNISPTK